MCIYDQLGRSFLDTGDWRQGRPAGEIIARKDEYWKLYAFLVS